MSIACKRLFIDDSKTAFPHFLELSRFFQRKKPQVLKTHGFLVDTQYKIRTCDPIRVKDVLYH